MRLSNFRISAVIATGVVLVTSSLATPARADDFDSYFASQVHVERDLIGNWGVKFVPTKNSYAYEIQVAGKDGNNNLACTRFAASDRKQMSVQDVKANIGITKAFDASVGADAQFVDVYGGFYNRVPSPWYSPPVNSEVHLRVAAYDQSGKQLYETGWYGAPTEDILQWNWPSQCSWVKS